MKALLLLGLLPVSLLLLGFARPNLNAGTHYSGTASPGSAQTAVSLSAPQIALLLALPMNPPPRQRSQGSVQQNIQGRKCSTVGKSPICSSWTFNPTACSSNRSTLICSAFSQTPGAAVSCSVLSDVVPAGRCSAKPGGFCSAFGPVGITRCSTNTFGATGVCTALGPQAFCSASLAGATCSVISGAPGTGRCQG